jgi:hypothetical protein
VNLRQPWFGYEQHSQSDVFRSIAAAYHRHLLGVAAQWKWRLQAFYQGYEAHYHTNKMNMHVAMFRKWIMIRIDFFP